MPVGRGFLRFGLWISFTLQVAIAYTPGGFRMAVIRLRDTNRWFRLCFTLHVAMGCIGFGS
jgi:hypothetical protein